MGIHTRNDLYNATTNISLKEIMKSSRMVQNITGSFVQPNKSIVGANAFAHESGIHQDGVLKAKRTYEIMDAETIGLSEAKLVLGKHSGRHAFSQKLKELGYELDGDDLNKAFDRFKLVADSKKEVSDKDLESLVSDEIYQGDEIFRLKYVQIVAGNTTRPIACVQLTVDGETIEGSQTGAGPVDAIFQTIDHIIQEKFNLLDFSIHSVTGGTDALGEVTVRIQDGGNIFTGRGSELDVLVASTKAYLHAINKMVANRNETRVKPTL